MNWKKWMWLGLAWCLPWFGTGCRNAVEADARAGAAVEDGTGPVVYEAGRGLRIETGTREAMGLGVAPVGRGRFRDHQTVMARRLHQDGNTHLLRALIRSEQKPDQDAGLRLRWAKDGATVPARRIGLAPDPVTAGAEWELLVTNEERFPTEPAQSMELIYSVGPERESLEVPAEAVVQAAVGEFVYEEADGYLLRRPVGTGAVNDGRVEIRSGLAAGSRVVGRGAESLWILELAMVGGIGNLDQGKEGN
jgi:hypothetical protein